MLPPTSQLPPIRKLAAFSIDHLIGSVRYLRKIYNPQVRGITRRKGNLPPSSAGRDSLDELRTDSFERTYAIKWLTALIGHFSSTDECDSPLGGHHVELLIQDAASLLAICAGTAAAGIICRTFIFESRSGSVTVNLTDAPLENQDYGSVGAQTWGGACVLAEMITDKPESFGLLERNISSRKLRVLELGAGTGLVSLALAGLMQKIAGREVEIVATDYYPSVLTNLATNVRNNSLDPADLVKVTTHHLDWSLFSERHPQPQPLDQPFDLVLGADIIYEAQHAVWIQSCLAKLLRNTNGSPDDGPEPIFHLVIPLRVTHTFESETVEFVFAQSGGLVIKYKEIILCDAETGREGDEVEYAYYKIGWAKEVKWSFTSTGSN